MISDKKVLGIIGPSGCGKSTIVEKLHNAGVIHVNPTITDRPTRVDEKDIEHSFVSSKKFDELASSEKFLEIVQPFGLRYRYGTPKLKFVQNRVPVLMLRAQYVPKLLTHYPNSIIYQIEASFEFATSALASRSGSYVGNRLSGFEPERKLGRVYADRVFVNDGDVDTLVDKIIKNINTDLKY